MGKGEAAMGERGGEEEGTANTKLGEGDVPDEEQEGNQQHDPQVSKQSYTNSSPSSLFISYMIKTEGIFFIYKTERSTSAIILGKTWGFNTGKNMGI